ncbi:putative helicase MOV-10 [Schistocerca serialis cubense]|uniref:putative helicase MOV-10 n=1 Tax=Schistocerca serialis cubense TaxID=2023355 RepID=UPI00214EE830|nr:putative helicase MOV-10 [Schistocerca serialis cubense]
MSAATRNRNARRRRNQKKDDPDLQRLKCQLCPYHSIDEADFESHKRTFQHKFNYCQFQFQKHRNRLVKDRHGAQIDCKVSSIKYKSDETGMARSNPSLKYDQSDGTLKTLVSTDVSHIVFDFIVKNTWKEAICVRDAYLLHPYDVFNTKDEKGLVAGQVVLRIHPDSSYIVSVIFENKGVGSYGVPVQFEIEYSKEAVKDVKEHSQELKKFNIVRVLVINVQDEDNVPPDVIPHEPSPFRRLEWDDVEATVEGTWPNGGPIKRMTEYTLPYDHYLMFYFWPGPWENMTSGQCDTLCRFTTSIYDGYANLRKNYVHFMHDLIYLEEYDGMVGIQVYNMCGVCLEHVTHSGSSQFKLEVPGLAEKRPSLLKGDLAYVRIQLSEKNNDVIEYESVIAEVRESAVLLAGFANEFLERYFAAQPTELRFAVRFAFNRYPLVVMHRAIDYCERDKLLDVVVFPRAPKKRLQTFLNGRLNSISFYNRQLVNNPAQKQAVVSILQGSSRPAPYIIYGPPGTGKTATLVEAILQVKKMMPGSYCLVAAPSNAACDNVAQQLAPHCSPKELLRLHSSTRDWDTVPADIYDYSNRSEGMYYFPSREDLCKYRIVVITLVFCGRLVERCSADDGHRHFTHVFIDECGQAKEPETLVALGGIVGPASNSRLGGQVVLAGDPQQLGPVCTSRRAECLYPTVASEDDDGTEDSLDKHIGLGVSMLERLMKTCELYQEPYDPIYITQLVYNYRSHPDILHLPNVLFYGGNLQERCPDSVRNDPVLSFALNGSESGGRAVVFHGVIGHEQREGQSPSHFNRYEVTQVLKYVDRLTGPKANVKLKQTDIGIIAPYIRQAYKIKAELKKRQLLDIEVGTTEIFQGREKRAIIISTVRSNRNLLDYDQKYQLGFLVNPKRLNVAITRAQSLLIIIGNPILLAKDYRWRHVVEYTRELGTYYGCPYQPRDGDWISTVTHRIENLNMLS